MLALVIVMLDERLDLLLEIAGQELVFQQGVVLQGPVPAFDCAFGSAGGMARRGRGSSHSP